MKIFFKTFATVLLLVFLSVQSTAANSATADVLHDKVDAFVTHLMETFDVVPGYSVAVVGKDGPILVQGYGITNIENGASVNQDTQFYIASASKSLTGMAIASLAEKGLLDLDVPISVYLLKAAEFAGDITLRELLNHTAGRTSEALTWRTAFSGDHNPVKLLEVFGMSTEAETGKAFAYDNFGYVVASLVLEEVFNKSWKDIVAEEVLDPLKMTRTTSYVSKLDMENVAFPHGWFGKIHSLPILKQDNTMHAAGGHFTTANDMARWLEALLNEGTVGNTIALVPSAIEAAKKPTASLEMSFYRYNRKNYGMGWYIADYEGVDLWQQFGSFSGYRSHVSFSPELGVGVAVLINELSPAGFSHPDMIASYVYDIVAGTENAETTYEAEFSALKERMAPYMGRDLPERPRNAPADESRYTGDFHNAEFGTFSFFLREGQLWGKFGNLESATTYKEDGSVRIELMPYSGTLVFFNQDEYGAITSLRYRGADYQRQ